LGAIESRPAAAGFTAEIGQGAGVARVTAAPRVARGTTEAANGIDSFCTELGRDLDNASVLLARHRHVRSDAWFDLRDRLSRDCWRVGSALHCLYEWPEPDDATADRDDLRDPRDKRLDRVARERIRWLRSGRRNPNSWTGGRYEEALASRPRRRARLITVPAELVGDLRLGLQNELTVPAEGIIELFAAADRGQRAQQYQRHFEYLDDVCAVLDLVGWAKPKQPAAIAIDLCTHRRAVISALDFAVSSLTHRLEDAEEELEPSKLKGMTEHVVALREFTEAVHRIADELQAEDADDPEQPGAPVRADDRELAALGRAVGGLREERGLTVAALAAAAKVDPERIAAIQAGQHDPDFDLLVALAEGLDVKPSTLFQRAEVEGARCPDSTSARTARQ
jgi:DNA-binding XRE family transcriptional regulator